MDFRLVYNENCYNQTLPLHIALRYSVFFLLVLFSVMAGAQTSHEQQYIIHHLGVNDGLDNMSVYSVLQGETGEIWIGTKSGINRYNGNNIQNYRLDGDMIFSNVAGRIFSLYKDRENNIYAYDNKGNVYQYKTWLDRFIPVLHLKQWLNGDTKLNRIYIDNREQIWLATRSGLFIYKCGKIRRTGPKEEINDICEVDESRGRKCVVIATDHRVWVQNVNSWKVLHNGMNICTQSLYYDKTTHLLWVGTLTQGICVYNLKTGLSINSPFLHLSHNPVRAILPLDATRMLAGIDGAGVYLVDRHTFRHRLLFNAKDETDNALTGNGIYTIYVDQQKNIWMGSYTGGVDVAIPSLFNISIFRHEYKDVNSLIDNTVNAICETSDGTLWFATNLGLSIYHPKTGLWQYTLKNKVVLTLCRDGSQCVWAGTYGNGVYQVKENGLSHEVYSLAKGNLKSNYITSLALDTDGRLWIGCIDNELACESSPRATYYPIREVQCLTPLSDGRMAAGTTAGFYIVNKRTNKQQKYFLPSEFLNHDVNCYIESIIFMHPDEAWLGTDGGGIYTYNIRTHRMSQITKRNGLPSNCITALCHDSKGRIFISTDNGLAMILPGQRNARKLIAIKGIDQEYNRMACCLTHDGHLLFGGNNGAVILEPSQMEYIFYKAILNIRDINVVGSTNNVNDSLRANLYRMVRKGKVNLSYNQNTFEINFECINYRFQYDIQYEYMLKGFDNQWVTMPRLQNLRYTNLPPGDYTLYIRSISRTDGHIIDQKQLEINIARPWWNSFFAWVIYIILLSWISSIIWKWYHSRLKQRYYNEKINFFVNTAHDIRTPLSLVLAPLNDIAKDESLSSNSRCYLDIARKNGGKLLNIITSLLDFQKVDRYTERMSVQEFDVASLLKAQADKFRLLAEGKHITLSVGECPRHQPVWMDPEMSDKIFENLLSNAIKYTQEDGKIVLEATTDDHSIYIKVKDNGIGIPQKAQKNIFQNFYRAPNGINTKQMGSGLGLILCRRLVEAHHGKLSFISKENEGTVFVVQLPQGNAHFRKFMHNDTDRHENNHVITEERKDNVSLYVNHRNKTFDLSSPDVLEDQPTSTADDRNRDSILFVDDNIELLHYMQLSFSEEYNIIIRKSAEEALTYLKNNTCNIVVSDVMMEGMDGTELCKRIKENADISWIPVILLTAKSGKDFVVEGLQYGADDYITKPFDTDILKSKIRSILDNRRRLSKYYLNRSIEMASQVRDRTSSSSLKSVEADDETTSEPQLNIEEKAFVEKATQIVLDHLSDENFDINKLCREMTMSRTLFYGKIKALTSESPQKFIQSLRLEQAAALLKQGYSVLDVSTMAGFVNVKYFSTVFKKYFGVSPSKYKLSFENK